MKLPFTDKIVAIGHFIDLLDILYYIRSCEIRRWPPLANKCSLHTYTFKDKEENTVPLAGCILQKI